MASTGEKIIQSSLTLFAQKGFEATSIRDIAQEANINSSTLYYYIKNKEDFLISIMKLSLNRLIKNAEEVIDSLNTPEQCIAALVQLHVMFHGVHRLSSLVSDTEFRALHGENKTIIKNLRKKYEMIWVEVIHNGVLEKKFLRVNDPKLTAFALLEMCTGVVHWYSPNGRIPLVKISDEYANMALNLLGAELNEEILSIENLDLPCVKNYMDPDFSEINFIMEVLEK